MTCAFGSPRRLLGFYNGVKDHRGSSSMATRVQIYGGNWYFTHTVGGGRIGGRVLVWLADPAPVPAVQHLALLLVFSASRALSPFVSFRFVSFRFASSLSTVALLALLVQTHMTRRTITLTSTKHPTKPGSIIPHSSKFNSAYTFKCSCWRCLFMMLYHGRCHHAHRKRPDRLGWKGPLGARKAHARAYPEKPCLSRVFSSFCGSY